MGGGWGDTTTYISWKPSLFFLEEELSVDSSSLIMQHMEVISFEKASASLHNKYHI